MITNDENYEKGFEMIFLGLKIMRPKLTQEEAENIIINIGNYIQLKRLRKDKLQTISEEK